MAVVLPADHPFSVFLMSKDPALVVLGVAAAKRRSPFSSSSKYHLPFLNSAQKADVQSVIAAGGVLDPLNVVFWGRANRRNMTAIIGQLKANHWRTAIPSGRQWGLRQSATGPQNVESKTPLSPFGRDAILFIGRLKNILRRVHVRLFEPFYAGPEWGYLTLAGVHEEALRRRKSLIPFWHKVLNWDDARNLFLDDLRLFLRASAFTSPRVFPSKGVWQGCDFDGEIVFVRVG